MFTKLIAKPFTWRKLAILPGWLLVIGCGDSTQFAENAVNTGKAIESITTDNPAAEGRSDDAAPQPEQGSDDQIAQLPGDFPEANDLERGGNSVAIDPVIGGFVKEGFRYGDGAAAPLVDYLFVLDNSCSMDEIRANVSSGFLSILGKNILPPRSKLGVMSTLIADDSSFSQTHTDISGYAEIAAEPGFLELVTAQSISDYQALNTEYNTEWQLGGCDSGWFNPDEKSADGNYCLTAATQASMSCLGAEAGLHAVKQLIAKNRANGTTMFRDGAVVNVIFVSDTHDPGTPSQALIDSRPSYTELAQDLDELQPTAGLRLHALAPAAVCTIEQMYDFSYYTAADASGGSKADSCNTLDYTSFMESMVETSKKAVRAVFTLAKPASMIQGVSINGVATADFEILDAKNIAIPALEAMPGAFTIEVTYSL